MCGIVGICAQRNVVDTLIAGLKALEYRGYDSAGLAVRTQAGVRRLRANGKVRELESLQFAAPLSGDIGIAHTRWATHGIPSEQNAHPQSSSGVSVVHNGIIENHVQLRIELQAQGYVFTSQTDSEVIAHLIEQHQRLGMDLLAAVRAAANRLEGSYAIAVLSDHEPGTLIGARSGSPLVLGLGKDEHYLASDVQALLPLTRRFIYLDDGDTVRITASGATIHDHNGSRRERAESISEFSTDAMARGTFPHYMLKEIHEQPQALAATLEGHIANDHILPGILGPDGETLLSQVRSVRLVGCGTSLHAAMIACYWIESLSGIPCAAEVASEYRYRSPSRLEEGTLYISITQSGETSDTLAALRCARQRPYLTRLAICNVAESSAVRESDRVLMTRAGAEIGVASTKAFTAQLAALALLALELARLHGTDIARRAAAMRELHELPQMISRALAVEPEIRTLAYAFLGLDHALFIGRGVQHPLALEGALKMKEITYIHAEGFAAGELKHGSLALVDSTMPVIALAASDALHGKLLSNVEEVRARGGRLFVFADERVADAFTACKVVRLPACGEIATPVVFAVAVQLLSYHVAALLGTDIDQPRNLAKSVTVE